MRVDLSSADLWRSFRADWWGQLKRAYTERTGIVRHGVRLPSPDGIEVGGDPSFPTLRLKSKAVSANMQNAAGAFEGWALVLMVWCGARGVAVDWEPAAAAVSSVSGIRPCASAVTGFSWSGVPRRLSTDRRPLCAVERRDRSAITRLSSIG